MWCEVPFHLPGNIEVIWRFAEEVRSSYDELFRFTANYYEMNTQTFKTTHYDFLPKS